MFARLDDHSIAAAARAEDADAQRRPLRTGPGRRRGLGRRRGYRGLAEVEKALALDALRLGTPSGGSFLGGNTVGKRYEHGNLWIVAGGTADTSSVPCFVGTGPS